MNLRVGQKAPAFSLPDQAGTKVRLKDFQGSKLIVYFYPKDMTPGCTVQACDFRDNHSRFKRRGYQIVGISRDSSERHTKFIEKYKLNFPLLADEDGIVCQKYGVWQEKKLYGKASMGIVRTTFLIDEKGTIAKIFEKVKVKEHIEALLAAE